MEPHAFVAEVYRRMTLRHRPEQPVPSWAEIKNDPRVKLCADEVRELLPSDKSAPILDLGFGGGWFLAACLRLGHKNLSGAEFGIETRAHVKAWAPEAITLFEIKTDIGTSLADEQEQYDFIHMSHVIEHIPKYSLFWVVDAMYRALRPGGRLMLRTPNMEGPCANSTLFVTLAHEYGFSSGNLTSLLDICGFDEIQFHRPSVPHASLKQRVGQLMRWPFLKESRIRHRLFGVSMHELYDAELIVTARRGQYPPLFDPKFR